jgi:signal transduction histidine kinase/CheY-like chemotaxis protein
MLERARQRYQLAQALGPLELEQGKLRLAIVVLVALYFLVAFLWDQVLVHADVIPLIVSAATLAIDALHFAWIVFVPGLNPMRRVAGTVLDMGAITLLMIAGGEAGAPLFGLYLWVSIGNGFRYGRWYLHCAQGLAVAGFAVVIWLSPFWRQHPMVGVAVVVALLAVPVYVSLLVARLQSARREAEAANIAKTKFLAAASHDLRQPMQALSMYATVLEERVKEEHSLRVVHGIQLSVTTLERMFDSLLDIAKIESGIVKPTIVAFPLMPLIERVVEAERSIAAQKDLRLHAVRTSVSVRSDPALLERMLKNLVTNAIRYTERGRILIGCRRVGADQLRLEVIDSGIGIALEEQGRIFDEYYQIVGSSAQGLGLGLPIVKSLGGLLGHPVSVKSAVGKGSAFSIGLARARDVAPEATVAPAHAAVLARLSVVLVDDDVQIRESMGLLLKSWGCHTVCAGTVGEIEEELRNQSITPDAVIADYRLADAMSGVEVVQRLRAVFGTELPALIITGTANPDHLQNRAKGIPFAMKPVAPGRLRAFLSQARRHARA